MSGVSLTERVSAPPEVVTQLDAAQPWWVQAPRPSSARSKCLKKCHLPRTGGGGTSRVNMECAKTLRNFLSSKRTFLIPGDCGTCPLRLRCNHIRGRFRVSSPTDMRVKGAPGWVWRPVSTPTDALKNDGAPVLCLLVTTSTKDFIQSGQVLGLGPP